VLEQATNLTRDISVKLRQAVEPAIGHLKSDHRLQRCWLQGALGDALHAVSAASIPS
jgi:IS5 family transposase